MHDKFLAYFDAVAQHGSIRKAAAHLNVSSSSVNRKIIGAEERFGVRLFDRHAEGVELTAAGAVVLEHCRRTLFDYRKTMAVMDDIRELRTGHIDIATLDSVALSILPDLLERFSTAYPQISFTIRMAEPSNVADSVVEGAFAVLDGADLVREVRDDMRALTLNEGEEQAFAHAALQLRYDPEAGAAPVTERDVLRARRMDDTGDDLWSTFNRVQENMLKGGLNGRARNGRRTTTRAVTGIDQGVKLNRALFVLAQEMKRLKG